LTQSGLGCSFKTKQKFDRLFSVVQGCKKETTLKSPVEGGGEVELQMPLPAMPTSYAVAFLLLDARKYTESGVYVLDRAGLQLYAWQLSEKVMDSKLSII
jgi:hypothetical protein